MRNKVPATMMTQHPDSAAKYVSIQEEPAEALDGLTPPPAGLGMEEIMIDFEGKLTPYHQTAQIVLGLLEKDIIPGQDVFVTPRVANAREETAFRQIMALLSIMETIVSARDYSDIQSVIEIVLPMVNSAEELIEVKKRIGSVVKLAHTEFGVKDDLDLLQIIPLIEEVPELLSIDEIFTRFIEETREAGYKTDYLRFMLGRSDPALSYGNTSAVLANKIAISKAYQSGEKLGIDIYPILGGGSLPFRGHVTLDNIENILNTYAGVRTITIQSALRYDKSRKETRDLAEILRRELPLSSPHLYQSSEYDNLANMIGIFTSAYLDIFFDIMEPVSRLSDYMPKQRDRLARKSGVGYARDIARPDKIARYVTEQSIKKKLRSYNTNRSVSLPRAITFTASLYSIGLPPVFLGTGRGLKELKKQQGEAGIKKLLNEYPNLKQDLEFAARFVNLDNLRRFFPAEVMKKINEDVEYSCQELNINLPGQPELESDIYHVLMDSAIGVLFHLNRASEVSERPHETDLLQNWLKEMGNIRGALG